MQERIVVWGSLGHVQWATWIDSLLRDDRLVLVVESAEGKPHLLHSGETGLRVVGTVEEAQQIVRDDRAAYVAQGKAQDARIAREMGWPVRQ